MLDAPVGHQLALRPPDVVMRLARMGSAHQTRLSFLRALLRRVIAENWRVMRPRFDIDARGVGVALYVVDIDGRRCSLVAFAHDLPAEQRSDRVIAEAWDATFALYDGVPDAAEIARLALNVPRQEAGRYQASELVLARANRSVRLFDAVVAALSAGRQPDAAAVEATGYLMRTTAVYGNGKFGIADRDPLAARPEFAGPFRAEMLTVYLIRAFTLDLVEHLARLKAPGRAAALAPDLRRRFGIGNSTGLGMAPFLVRHPALIDRWISARETALALARAQPRASMPQKRVFLHALVRSQGLVAAWATEDPVQAARLPVLSRDLDRLAGFTPRALDDSHPWDALYRFAEAELSLEGQELTATLVIEPNGAFVDHLADDMALDEADGFRIDGRIACGELLGRIRRHYAWAFAHDFRDAAETQRFWYVSEEKLEPRLGDRFREAGAEREQPLAIARDVVALAGALTARPPGEPVARFLLDQPQHRHTVRRVEIAVRHPYAEIRDNLIGAELRAIDILRLKLAFFGVTRFDPRSDRWLRITLFQGAPFPHELGDRDWDLWIYG